MKDEVMFVGKNVHGSMGTGVVTIFETKLPTKNKTLSGKEICSEYFLTFIIHQSETEKLYENFFKF